MAAPLWQLRGGEILGDALEGFLDGVLDGVLEGFLVCGGGGDVDGVGVGAIHDLSWSRT